MKPLKRLKLLFSFALLIFAQASSFSQEQREFSDTREVIELEYRHLWDSRSATIEDYQILGRQLRDFEWGDDGEIFIADMYQSRVVHISTSGQLLNIIGRQGDGPGEFQQPAGVSYNQQRKLLWVAELGVGARISLFKRTPTGFEYQDRMLAPTLTLDGNSFPIAETEDTYWIQWLYRMRARGRGLSRESARRVSLVNLNGEVVREFGDIWESPYGEMNWTSWNGGMLESVGDRLVFIAIHPPIIEVWTKEGELVRSREFDGPIFRLPKPERLSRFDVRTFSSFRATTSCDGVLYVLKHHQRDPLYLIFAIDPATLNIIREYHLPYSEDDGSFISSTDILVENYGDQIRVYGLDSINSSILIMEQKRNN